MPNGVRMNPQDPEITESDALYARALGLIPALTQTLAKGPGQWVRGVAPKYLARGVGSHVFDVDGNEFIDYQMGVGPLSLGYAYPRVDDAIRAQLGSGITFSLMHPLEVEVAELVEEVVPCAESVRFSKTGCDVTTAAVRLARAFTGREKVLCCGYHGWHDWYIGVTDRAAGIPQSVKDLTYTFPYNDLPALEEALDEETACVILEPTTFEAPREGFLEGLAAACRRAGALLIFDEMWTGFRLALGGAQEFFGVTPDLACFSKAVANGMPLSILAGRKDVMSLLEQDVFFFTTFGGEALSLAAAKATILEMQEKDVPARQCFHRHAHFSPGRYSCWPGRKFGSAVSSRPLARSARARLVLPRRTVRPMQRRIPRLNPSQDPRHCRKSCARAGGRPDRPSRVKRRRKISPRCARDTPRLGRS